MTLDEIANSRRSIRAYKKSLLTVQEINSKLNDAFDFVRLNAPSWKNSQTHRYYVAVSEEQKALVVQSLAEGNRPKCTNAVALIVTAFEKDVSGFTNGMPDNELGNLWGAYDLGLSDSLLILKIRELGLDSLIMGLRDSESLRKNILIPDSQIIASVISVGERAEDVPHPNRKELKEFVKIN